MASVISVTANNFNASKVSFTMGVAKNGRNPPINMKYGDDEKSKSFFQYILPTSSVRLLSRVDDKTGAISHSLSYTFPECDPYGVERNTSGSENGKVFNSLLDLQEYLQQAAIENSVKFFGKKRSEEVIRESFKRIINVSTDKIDGERVPNGKYPPSCYIKIPIYDGEIKMGPKGFVDQNGNPMNVTPENLDHVFPKKARAQLAIVGSVYTMAGGGFGVSWKLRAAKIYAEPEVDAAELFGSSEVKEEEAVGDVETQEDSQQRPVTPVEQLVPQASAAPAAPARKKRTGAGGY